MSSYLLSVRWSVGREWFMNDTWSATRFGESSSWCRGSAPTTSVGVECLLPLTPCTYSLLDLKFGSVVFPEVDPVE